MIFTKYAKIVEPSGNKTPVKDKLTIGRGSQCDIVVPEKYGDVKEVHATVSRDAGRYHLSADAEALVYSFMPEGKKFGAKLRELMIKDGAEEDALRKAEEPGWKLIHTTIQDAQTGNRMRFYRLNKDEQLRLGKGYEIKFEM